MNVVVLTSGAETRDKIYNIVKSKFQRVVNEKISIKARLCTGKYDHVPALRACCRSLSGQSGEGEAEA